MMARYEQIGDLSDDGDVIADAMRAEADAIVFEATDDHGRLAGFGLDELPPARGPAGPHPDPLQHRAAGVRPVRDRARRRPGRPPRRPPDPRLGRRDAAVPAGRPAHGLGAGPGRRAAHAHPRRRRRAPDGPRRGRRRDRRGGPRRGERRHGQQGRHVHAGRAGGAPRHPVLRRAPRRARSTSTTPDGAAIPIEERAADEVRSIRGVAHRARRDRGPQPGLRRHAGRADHRDRHRGGRRPRPVRGRVSAAAHRGGHRAAGPPLPGHDRRGPRAAARKPVVAAG